jgi:hypothetical protein
MSKVKPGAFGSRIRLIRWRNEPDGWVPEIVEGRLIDRESDIWFIETDDSVTAYSSTEWSMYRP